MSDGFLESLLTRQGLSPTAREVIWHLSRGRTWKEYANEQIPGMGGLISGYQAYDEVVGLFCGVLPTDSSGSGFYEALLEREDLTQDEWNLIEHLIMGGTWSEAGRLAQLGTSSVWAVMNVYDALVFRHRRSQAA